MAAASRARGGSRRRRPAPGRPAVQGRARYVVTPRVLLFLTRGGRWLFLEGGPGKWFAGRLNGLGGSVEAGEDARAAAVREAREECGLAPSVLRLAAVVHVDGRGSDRATGRAGTITLDGVRRNARAERGAGARQGRAEVGVLVFVFAGKLPPGPLRASSEGRLVWHPLASLRDPAVPFLDDVRTLLPRVAAQRAGAVPFFVSSTT